MELAYKHVKTIFKNIKFPQSRVIFLKDHNDFDTISLNFHWQNFLLIMYSIHCLDFLIK